MKGISELFSYSRVKNPIKIMKRIDNSLIALSCMAIVRKRYFPFVFPARICWEGKLSKGLGVFNS